MKLTQNNKTDFLEIVIVMAMFLLIVVIYVPVAIWEEEDYYEKQSRYRMQNLYDLQTFYSRLVGSYNTNFPEVLSVVNAARDSAIADSLFSGNQIINIYDKEYYVDVDESFSFDYDTTFGIKSFRKDTIFDTTLQIVLFDADLGRNDTSFIRKVDIAEIQESENYIETIKEEPLERVQAIEYYKTYIPDNSTNYCPLTGDAYLININEDGSELTIASPIQEVIEKPRYLLFSFKAKSHGIIKDGRKSWD